MEVRGAELKDKVQSDGSCGAGQSGEVMNGREVSEALRWNVKEGLRQKQRKLPWNEMCEEGQVWQEMGHPA